MQHLLAVKRHKTIPCLAILLVEYLTPQELQREDILRRVRKHHLFQIADDPLPQVHEFRVFLSLQSISSNEAGNQIIQNIMMVSATVFFPC